ncbi:MAG TPA: hypothetical protein VFQ44_11950 [Streptosporangiaceae bacterium]|nr:hypothetical protein [Streptosporangiaceae bacterium]
MGVIADSAVRRWALAHARTVVKLPRWTMPAQVSGDASRPLGIRPGTIRHWHVVPGPLRSLAAITLPGRGQLLLATGGDGTTRIWDWKTCRTLDVVETGEAIASLSWTMSGDQPLLVINSSSGTVWLWNGHETRRLLTTYRGITTTRAWGVSPDEQPLLAIGSPDGSVRVSDGRSGGGLRTIATHPGGVTSIAWAQPSDGSSMLATGGEDGTVRIWDGVSGTALLALHGSMLTLHGSARIIALAWVPLPDGQMMLASVERNGEVRLWDARTGSLAWDLPTTAIGHVSSVAAATGFDGEPLLMLGGADGRVRMAEIHIDPAEAPQPPAPAPAPAPVAVLAKASEGQAGPAEEIVPPHWTEPPEALTTAIAWASAPGERPLLATGHDDGAVRIWNADTGAMLRIVGLGFRTSPGITGAVRSVACAILPDGRRVLASGHDDGSTLIRDGFDGDDAAFTPVRGGHNVRVLAWAVLPGGGLRLAAADADGTTRVLGGHDGKPQWSVSHSPAWSVAWAVLPDGRLLLATGNKDGRARIYDGHTGTLLQELADDDASAEVNSVSWAVLGDGQVLLAAGSDDGKVRIWDGINGTLMRTLTEPSGAVFSVSWTVLADDTPMLATAGKFDERSTRIWHGRTFERIASLPGARGVGASLAWLQPGDGRLLLCTTPGMSELPARIWSLGAGGAGAAGRSTADAAAMLRNLGPIEAGLLALGRVDLWPPLGLVDDLVTLTGPDPADQLELNDGRLRSLAQHAGIRRLRELHWPAPARISLAGLLASGLSLASAFRPPAGATAPLLGEALAQALADAGDGQRATPTRVADVDLAELSAAADTVTDRMTTMLAILGARAVAADPALPLLLAQSAGQLPVLPGKQMRMLAEPARHGRTRPRESDGGLRHAPGTAGIGRRGSLTQLLPTQLALPPDLLAIRYVQDHLLYRRHVARIPPTPEPVTLILDTTPPTFGPVENVLRLVAHLITTVLWEHGEHPVLISLDEPAVAAPLTSRAHLARLWTTRSLSRPGPAIVTALDAAAQTGSGLVLLTHHHTPDRYYLPGPDRRLVTSHHPAEQPPPIPSLPSHYHLPPDPARALLTAVVWALLTPRGQR